MKIFKNIFTWMSAACLLLAGQTMTSCSDDMSAENMYVAKTQMMSDFLKSDPDFALFVEVVERSGRMNLLSTYGEYTCFAPTNEAVERYLEERGLSSVEEMSMLQCDTITRNHLLPKRCYMATLGQYAGNGQIGVQTLQGVRLNIKSKSVLSEETGQVMSTYILADTATILYNSNNDSVENGVVHAVDNIIPVASAGLLTIIAQNPDFTLMNEAILLCGFDETINDLVEEGLQWREWWNSVRESFLPMQKAYYSGAQWDYCWLPPSNPVFGFTALLPPDVILKRRYGISEVQQIYDLAQLLYGGEAGLDVHDEANREKVRDHNGPLYKFVSYHFLDRKAPYDCLTSWIGVDKNNYNPTEYVSTLCPNTTIKCTNITTKQERDILRLDNDNTVYLNHSVKWVDPSVRDEFKWNVPGARVYKPSGDALPGILQEYESTAENGYLYYLDDIVYWSDKNHQGSVTYNNVELPSTQATVFNERMRLDIYFLFPELTSNEIRNPDLANRYPCESQDPNQNRKNYIFPNGYLKNVEINEDGHFFWQAGYQGYWSYQQDEFNLQSDVASYDIEIPIPNVPEGQYQIRLGFANMATRGICQFYYDGEQAGLPFDMRETNFEQRTSWVSLKTLLDSDDEEYVNKVKKTMHNKGWYHGPKGASPTGDTKGSFNSDNYFGMIARTCRFVLGNQAITITEGKMHKIRIKSIWGPMETVAMIDYLELVPKAVYADPESPEDDY